MSAVIRPWVEKERQILVNQRIVAFKSNSITLKFNLLVSFFQAIPLYIQFFVIYYSKKQNDSKENCLQ